MRNVKNVKKRPPSYYRYKEKHPTVSVALTQELKDSLDKYRGDMSYGEAIKDLLKKTKKMSVYNEGHTDGYKKGEEDFRIWYYCAICGEPITIQPNSEVHNSIISYLKERGWGHAKCHEKKKKKKKKKKKDKKG